MNNVKRDPRPLYLIVKDRLLELIKKGYYTNGSKLPSEFELAKDFGVSRPTLREALRVLEEENILVKKHGVGTFVNSTPTKIKSGIENLLSVTESIEQLNLKAGTKILSVQIVTSDDKDGQKLNLSSPAPLIKLERVRTADGEPVVFCIDKIPQSNLDKNLFENIEGSIFELLESHYNKKITYAVSEIVPVLANFKLADALGISSRTPLLLLEQVHFTNDDQPILYSKNYFRADKFAFHVVRKRV
ncbi:GntR family transcriptional regulator [Anaerobranca gottschalkii]|uniref:Transcriptional regulator, GntR family n=1 Tax=Anaerobranca gottschalkii DSM 13577 TaxID=1120990 RepID=A0A1H9Z8V7_9FIRM|nr:GntR family transcriptional regulator [Anaerobranca gottschalkii]SES77762.1 transcriptional regulator, GntR family [Anaerobranca gottschalkii DSM 13577]